MPESQGFKVLLNAIFIMVDDSKTSNSVQRSKRVSDLLDGMKRYLRIEHHDDDKELLEYMRNQAGLHRE
jgi:hypothetical protein